MATSTRFKAKSRSRATRLRHHRTYHTIRYGLSLDKKPRQNDFETLASFARMAYRNLRYFLLSYVRIASIVPIVPTDFVPKLGLPGLYQNLVHATSTVTIVPSSVSIKTVPSSFTSSAEKGCTLMVARSPHKLLH
jgi:hypothetical protein